MKINGKQHYLWRAVDQNAEVLDVFLWSRRYGSAARRFFTRLLQSYGEEPRKIVTDKRRIYLVDHREVMSEAIHITDPYIRIIGLSSRIRRGGQVGQCKSCSCANTKTKGHTES